MSNQKSHRDRYRNANERHYCKCCNVWMGSDKTSISLHENGAKHRKKELETQAKRQKDKQQQEKAEKALKASIESMNKAAHQALGEDLKHFYNVPGTTPAPPTSTTTPKVETKRPSNAAQPSSKKDWEAKKRQRQEKSNKVPADEDDSTAKVHKKKQRVIGEEEGFYTVGESTYLEGDVFFGLLEPDLPVDIWTGSMTASPAEMRLPERALYWKPAIVAGVITTKELLDVAYLASPNDTQETMLRGLSPTRVRLVLGSDDKIPPTVKEARLVAMGGETIQVANVESQMDEATGFSGWSTVQIRRTTVSAELKQERERLREERQAKAKREAQEEKERNARKMEEAKYANQDDSALGAYDVWSQTTAGYKGVDIHAENSNGLNTGDAGRSLAQGQSVAFKKKGFKKKQKKQNIRTTSADD